MKVLYHLIHALWYMFSLLPLAVLYVLADVLYFLVAHIVKYRGKVIKKNIREAFPEMTEAEHCKIEKDFYHYFCDYLVETVKLMTMSEKQLRRSMVFEGTEMLEEMVDKDRSVDIYHGHYCNREWNTSQPHWVSDKALCAQIYHPLENKTFDNLFRHVRERQGAVCIPMTEVLRRIVKYKKQGQPFIMGYISDQAPMWFNIHHWVNFLHHDTPVFTGSERIMRSTGQAVFYGDVIRVKRGYYKCVMHPINLHPEDTKEWELTDIYFQKLEQTIRRHPGLYLWSHNRWKRTHEEFDLRYDKETGRVSMENLEDLKRRKGIQ